MLFPNRKRHIPMDALDKVLAYRDSLMGNMTNDDKLRAMAQTGFLRGGHGDGGNAGKAMEYLNSKLRNYSNEGGLNYLKDLFRGR